MGHFVPSHSGTVSYSVLAGSAQPPQVMPQAPAEVSLRLSVSWAGLKERMLSSRPDTQRSAAAAGGGLILTSWLRLEQFLSHKKGGLSKPMCCNQKMIYETNTTSSIWRP